MQSFEKNSRHFSRHFHEIWLFLEAVPVVSS